MFAHFLAVSRSASHIKESLGYNGTQQHIHSFLASD